MNGRCRRGGSRRRTAGRPRGISAEGDGVEGAQHGDVSECGLRLDDVHGLGAVAAAGFVDDAAKGFVGSAIFGRLSEAKEGGRVLDLRALIEPHVADDDIGDASPHQGFFQSS